VAWALASARNVPPANILGLLQSPDLPRTQVMEIINAHNALYAAGKSTYFLGVN
jgi:hypothetical protein